MGDDKLEILKMRDNAEGHRVHKDKAFDLPMRLNPNYQARPTRLAI